MEVHKKDGFFQKYCEKVRSSISDSDFKKFSALSDNESRFKFINGLRNVAEELKLTREFKGKSLEQSLALKNIGNKAFQNGDFPAALLFYNKCFLATPEENSAEMAIILANRSAALYHMEKFDAAIKDIDRAVALNYPKEMMYKLTERKARCYLGNKDNGNALASFKETLPALDNSKLPLEKRAKLERDSQIMIKLLPKNIEAEKKKGSAKKGKASAIPEHFIRKSLYFDYTEEEGRFAKTDNDIKPNEIILLEKPHVSVLLEEYSLTHCSNCFTRANIPTACPKCCDVIFCSQDCEKVANSTFHKVECGFLPMFWASGASITCHMALRIMSQKSAEYFVEMKDELNGLTSEVTDKLKNDDYRKIFKLVTHENQRTAEDFFHRTLMVTLLSSFLKLGGYFKGNDAENFIGSLILHNLQLLQFNAHEIAELQREVKADIGKSVFIGGGLYPTLALFNHSCDPSVTRYYRGNSVCVRSVKNIKSGSMVAENYGPLFTQVPLNERKDTLKIQYKFDCNCVACDNNWPLFKDMDQSYMRFKCDGPVPCNNVLHIPIEINEFMIKCTECGEHTNIMKGLKSLQDTDSLFKSATRLHETGDIEKALLKYVEMLKLLDEVLCPPYRDYHLCQQGLRSCMLEFGNHFTKQLTK